MARIGGNPGNRGNKNAKGRKPSKDAKVLIEMLDAALIAKGGQKWIELQMDENPTAIISLLGRRMPKVVDMKAEHTGDMQITTIQRTIVRPDK